MTQVTYPGVYIQEVPSGVRTITPVSTSICAFIDFFREGPMNEAVELTARPPSTGSSAACIETARRATRSTSSSRTVAARRTPSAWRAAPRPPPGSPSAATRARESARSTCSACGQPARARGATLLRARVSHNADDTFNLAVARYDGTDAAAKVVQAEPAFLNLSIDPASPRYVEKVVNDASALIQVEHLDATDTRLPAATGTLGRDITLDAAGIAALHTGSNKTFTVIVTDPGPGADPTIAHTATLDFDNTPANPAPTTAKGLRGKVEAAIQTAVDANGATHPLLAGATVQLIEGAAGYRLALVEPNRKAREFAPQLVLDVQAATGSTGADALGLPATA